MMAFNPCHSITDGIRLEVQPRAYVAERTLGLARAPQRIEERGLVQFLREPRNRRRQSVQGAERQEVELVRVRLVPLEMR